MKSRLARAGVVLAEGLGILVAAAILAAAFLFWRVQAAPVNLTWSAPLIQVAAGGIGLNDTVRKIDHIEIARAEERGGYRLNFAGVSLGGRRAEASAELPSIIIEFFPADIASGKVGPRRILVDGAALRIVRRSDRKLKIDFGAPTADRARVFQSLTGGAYFREAFKRAALSNVAITFIDENSGRTWIGRDGEASIERTDAGYVGNLASNFEIGDRTASLSFIAEYKLSSDVISSRLSLANAPVGDLVAVLFGENAELFTSPVSGDALVDFSSDGTVLSSKVDLRADAGVLTLGGWSTSISSFAAIAGFDPAQNQFNVEKVEWSGAAGAGALVGKVALQPSTKGKGVGRINFNLASDTLQIVQPEIFSEPLVVAASSVAGSYDLDRKAVSIDAIAAEIAGAKLEGGFTIARAPKQSPEVAAKLALAGTLSPQALIAIWPKRLAVSARNFVETRMPRGKLSAVDFTMDLKAGAISADGAIPDNAMTLAFRADDAEVIYAPGMTPMTGVAGDGVLKGNSFRFKAEKGAVAAVRVGPGDVEIPVLMPKGEPAYFRFSAEGDAGDLLAILSQEPLAVLAGTKFSADQFSGPVRARVEIQRPNLNMAPPESYKYRGSATFSSLAVDSIIGDASIAGGKGKLDLATEGMVITGDARVSDAPVTIVWRQKFFGNGDKTFINIRGVANSGTADLFGIPTRQMVQGEVPFTIAAVGGVDAFRELDLDADLTGAVLVSESLGWMKPQGKPAKGSARFAFSVEGTKVSGLALDGEGFSIAGEADFYPSGAVRSFNFPTFNLEGAANISISGERDETGMLSTNVEGKYLNGGEMIRRMIDDGGDGAGKAPFALSARIDHLDLRAGSSYRSAVLDFSRNADRIDALQFSAAGASTGAPLSITLNSAAAAGDASQTIEASSQDVGAMLAGIFGLTSVRGGEGRLEFSFTPAAADAPREGALQAHDLRVVKAPLLAKIFAAGSLTGLADLMNGDGIELKKAMARFSIKDGEVRISEARATGPSVGITAQGAFALDGDRALTLKGAVAPAYQVNSFLGKAPIIGDILVNRKGEGVLALSYDVDGPAAEPRVTVNPLSAFAPGVFRRMFEGRAPEEEATAAEQ